MFKVPWHLFDKKLDLEMKNCEVVEGERRATRYGKLGNTVRGLVVKKERGGGRGDGRLLRLWNRDGLLMLGMILCIGRRGG